MKDFFSASCSTGPFVLFSPPHIAAVLVVILFCLILYTFRKHIRGRKPDKILCLSLAYILVIQEILFQFWNIVNNLWSVDYTLPLQLCGISSILSAVMLFSGSRKIYEITYFWGVGGALQAIITPEIGIYTYPHFRYFQFFICHGAIIAANLYMTFIKGFRLKPRSVWKSFVLLNVYAVFIFIFNKLTDSNYMFLNAKPDVFSIMNYLGPWPWYILSLEGVALIIFFILYSPFIVLHYNKRYINDKNTMNF